MDKLEDEYETIRANWSFLYYVLAFIIFIVVNLASVIFQYSYHLDYKLIWLLNVFLCFVLEMVILDSIYAVLAKSLPAFCTLFKMRGFHYDYELHERFVRLDEDD